MMCSRILHGTDVRDVYRAYTPYKCTESYVSTLPLSLCDMRLSPITHVSLNIVERVSLAKLRLITTTHIVFRYNVPITKHSNRIQKCQLLRRWAGLTASSYNRLVWQTPGSVLW